MVDRQDIDALLVSALYGELTPAEEARLTAHLESHPADRTVLADLTHTRQAVKESRILAVQLDPPQSISALLMQEAARRAPRRVDVDEKVGWFQRFTRSFMAHPAMAAAAMLVIVVGVAGMLQMRKGDQFTDTPRPAPSANASSNGPVAAAADDDRQRKTEVTLDQKNLETAQLAVAGNDAGIANEAADGVNGKAADSYRVDLATGSQSGQAKAGDTIAAADPKAAAKKDAKEAEVAKAQVAHAVTETERQNLAREERDHAAGNKAPKGLNGIIVNGTDQPQPMDFERETPAAPEPTHETIDRSLAEGRAPAMTPAPGTGAAGGGAQGSASGPANQVAQSPARPPARNVRPEPPQAAPAPAAHASAGAPADNRRLQDKTVPSTDEKLDKDKDKTDNLLAWARTQHGRVVDSVKQNNCGGAAQLALQIYRSAPDYYRDNVASDRSLKSCMAYINSEHDKEVERVRAAKARALQNNDGAQPAQTQKH